MRKWEFIVLTICICVLTVSCRQKAKRNPHKQFQLSDIRQWTREDLKISAFRMSCEWDSLCRKDERKTYVDGVAEAYYSNHGPLRWISTSGVNPEADTLLVYLSGIEDHGLSSGSFYRKEIQKNLTILHQMDFDKENTISRVTARLDYYLTKAYYRYASVMKFGAINPFKLYNSLEQKPDSSYDRLYAIPSDVPGPNFVREINKALAENRIDHLLKNIQPLNVPGYRQLQAAYIRGGRQNRLLRLNLERLRWRYPGETAGKYVIVNIPARRLWAVNRDDEGAKVLGMRVCCGSNDSKTPLLDSRIYRVELNPFWIVPASIIKHGISLNPAYLRRKRMRIIDRATGRETDPSRVTKDMLMSAGSPYLVRQDNGEGNSLGRMIFRFQNDFSIFLHDTSDKGAFEGTSRDVSHGCIRVEKPLELAVFLLPDKGDDNEKTEAIFRRAISQKNPVGEDGQPLPLRSTYQSFSPAVPLFIHYYTAFVDPSTGRISTYPDIYGYDAPLWEQLCKW